MDSFIKPGTSYARAVSPSFQSDEVSKLREFQREDEREAMDIALAMSLKVRVKLDR